MPVPATPLCRCRVLYIGSAVPLKSKDGLQGIQDPLKQLYPVDHAPETKGVDAWLSTWINGLVLEYTESDKELFFPIQTLHYCAAVRYVNVGGYALEGGGEKFLPLDSPFANLPQTQHPPIFAAILRRTQGVKVLECHAFICMNEKAANALVRCCFNAYADSMYLDMTNEAMGIEPPHAGNGAIDAADSTIGASKIIKSRAVLDSRSASPRSDEITDGRNGYTETDIERSEQDKEINEAQILAAATAKYTWQNRQQSGDYETASIASSQAGKYKKKDSRSAPVQLAGSSLKAGKRPPSAQANYSNALVPYGSPYEDAGTIKRRSKSEMDIHMAARGPMGPQAMVPYMLPYMRPPYPPMFGPPRPPFPIMHQFPGSYPQIGGPMMPPQQPPFIPPFMGMPTGASMDPVGWRHPPPLMAPPFGQQLGMPPFYGPPMPPPSSQKQRKASKNQNGFYESRGPPMPPFATMPPYGMVPPRPPFRSFEEPPYLPGQMSMSLVGPSARMPFPGYPPPPRGLGFDYPMGLGMLPYYPMPPGSDGFPFEDDYLDSYRPKSNSHKYNQKQRDIDPESLDDSPISSGRSGTIKRSPIPDYWENRNVYDGSTLFRKQNLNEKAFGTSIQQETTQQPKDVSYGDPQQHRPPEPAPDYGRINGQGIINIEQANIETKFRNMNVNGGQQYEERTVYKESYSGQR